MGFSTRGVRRVADLHLRESVGSRVWWPESPNRSALLVLLTVQAIDDVLCRQLCADAGVVVLCARCRGFDDAMTAVGWSVDHAVELQVDPRRVVVSGVGAGAGLADGVAGQARSAGWPPLAHDPAVDAVLRRVVNSADPAPTYLRDLPDEKGQS